MAASRAARWQAIELARREWNHEQQGLTGLGALILTLVVAYFTAGMGSGLAGSSTAAAGGGTATTLGGVTLSTTTAAVSFVNNGGDLSAVFKDLGSSASVKQLLVGMASAGLAQGLADNLSFNGTALSKIKPPAASPAPHTNPDTPDSPSPRG